MRTVSTAIRTRSRPIGHLLEVADLDSGRIDALLERATGLSQGGSSSVRPTVGLLFEAPSLRTRVGYDIATARLGGHPVWIPETRTAPVMDGRESFADTLRVLSGMVDVVVVRTEVPLSRIEVEEQALCPVINGGDANLGHPTQALIDLFSMRSLGINLESMNLIVCGDATMRSVVSLVQILEHCPPRSLTVVTPPSRRLPDGVLGPNLQPRTRYTHSLEGVSGHVIYQAGLPAFGPEPVPAEVRSHYTLSPDLVDAVGASAVLSPLPLVDEITDCVRQDPRFLAFEHSDRSLWIRMAVLEQAAMGGL